MSHSEFRTRSLLAFLQAGPQDALDTLALNCMLLQWISRQLLAQGPASTADAELEKLANHSAASALNLINHVKFYDFLATTNAESLQFAVLRKIPQPKSMRLEAHLNAGYQVGAVVELLARCDGVNMPGGLSPDSLELTGALFEICRSLCSPESPPRREVTISGDAYQAQLPALVVQAGNDWMLAEALRAYRETAALGDAEPEPRLDIFV